MDGTIKYLERSNFRTDILNENTFLDMKTATGKLFQIGTNLEEKKYLLYDCICLEAQSVYMDDHAGSY